ncbi:Arp2/3 complex subunit Arc16 [Penicillium riverlandense]|uniref:Arp2/3 complex subunit Arc16 n=1 Tax=Penicillium riverlandense TaxID=1903569 RepID=UPI0025497382|nr:Arp2/3 complex subunit Arc16 [Penicillium riverlandense]KAJ5818494.1 Arp2/3 complex subunit Arc16 [Penicillium riverlandense]
MSQLDNFRTINIDRLDPESSANFPMETLLPATLPPPETSSDAANVATQVRQLLRGGDPEGALRHVLDTAPLGGDDRAKEVHLATVIEVLQGIRQGEMTRVLEGVCAGDRGSERADCLMKYLYKGMSSPAPGSGSQSPRSMSVSPQSTGGFSQIQGRNLGEGGGGQQMSVLLSWHEKLVEVAGTGSIVRVMTDRRTV